MLPETALTERLQSDITWRIIELSEIVRACGEASGTRQSALLRASIPVLYAHWEGYFVHAANSYLNFVGDKRILLGDLRNEFWALTIRKRYRAQQVAGSIQFNRFLLDIRSEGDRLFKKGNFERINGASNLKVEVLQFCCICLGINSDCFLEYYDFIDKDLLDSRNHIAHGSSLKFAPERIGIFRDKVVELMRITQTEIENAVATESYKK
ncbi:MAE_28990/MAE_18760 family HEPN-like nuclease [Sphingomonas faeni]|uniref:MAE_28990/MAE_18760 family HEPN-like nuclease n=1 Tax=Sphingomonas faeni TaxID=185950 RepID=UPI00334F926A